jgi:Domain of unknown function (DUF4410)
MRIQRRIRGFRVRAPTAPSAALAMIAVVALLAGCASTKVTEQQTFLTGPLPKPSTIWIHNFAGSPADVPPGTDFATLSTDQGPPPTPQEIATGRQLGAQLSASLVTDLQAMGLPAQLATPATRPQINDIVIQGCLYSVTEGSAAQRITIGFGAGASELSAAVEGFQVTPSGLRKLGSADVQSGGNKTPGMLLGAATYAATKNPAGLILATGMKVYGQESGKDTIQGRVDAAAKEIADQLNARFQAQGWGN